MHAKKLLFVTGIDTGIGKTHVTGLMARFLLRKKCCVITQKLVQTGTESGIAEDILEHRRLMGISVLPEDESGLTCPLTFKMPTSPHLAAALENREVTVNILKNATETLLRQYDVVLLEGAGGLHVPLRRNLLTIDFIRDWQVSQPLAVILVTSPRLGSINHTLAAIEALVHRNIPLAGLVYNHYSPEILPTSSQTSRLICADTAAFFREKLAEWGRPNSFVELPHSKPDEILDVDFSPLFFGADCF